MTDVMSSILEFKPVGNFHWIVNKPECFSFDQMTEDNVDNKFNFVPVSACNDNWRANINANYTLKRTGENHIVPCRNLDDNTDVAPPTTKLIATEVGYGGVIVSVSPNNSSIAITLGSEPQSLKGVFVVHEDTDVVLAYCILPEPIKVNNYIQLSYNEPIIEITSTVNTALE